MEIYIATTNAHKVGEFAEMFADSNIDCRLKSAADVEGFQAPEENGNSFEENAFIKAGALRSKLPKEAYVMADDSGIVVDALGGAPGFILPDTQEFRAPAPTRQTTKNFWRSFQTWRTKSGRRALFA